MTHLDVQALREGELENKIVIGSMNRGGLQGAAFEMDDRFTGYDAATIARMGFDGGKMLCRIDLADAGSLATLEACARAVSDLAEAGLMAMVEPFMSTRVGGRVRNDLTTDAVVRSVGIASALGATSRHTWLKLPVVDDMDRVMAATTLPTLLLGGYRSGPQDEALAGWEKALSLPGVRGLVVGRTLLYPADEDAGDSYVRSAQECIEVAERLGCPRLNLHGTGLDERGLPVVPVIEVTGAMWISALRTLARLAELGERYGVTFCLENLNTAVDHPGVPFARAEDTLTLVEAVGHPHMRMMLDLYHAQIGEGNLIELARRARPLIGEVQVADVPGRCEPGTGEINYPAICAALVAMGYDGPVGLEAWADGDAERALERFRAAFTLTGAELRDHSRDRSSA